MKHPTVLKKPYNFFHPLGFILVLVAHFDYETVSPAAKQQIGLEVGSGVYTMFLMDSGSQHHI